MALQMFGRYRKGDANDADGYIEGVTAILALYPPDVVQKVTDPRIGLPSKLKWLPQPSEVKDECEFWMMPRRIHEREQATRERVLAERKRDEEEMASRPRPTFAELQAKCAAVGIHIGKRSTLHKIQQMTDEEFKAKVAAVQSEMKNDEPTDTLRKIVEGWKK